VNDGNATAAEVLALIDDIKSVARKKRGIELETEVEIVGEPKESRETNFKVAPRDPSSSRGKTGGSL
jgi:hypothetical protein